MARTQFTVSDIERAFKGAARAGVVVSRMEIDRRSGNIIIVPGASFTSPQGSSFAAAAADTDPDAALDAWMAGNGQG